MSDYRVASRYAKSLIELAEEKSIVEDVLADMRLFAQVHDDNRGFALLLKNPIINHAKKLSVLEAVFGSKVNALTLDFFKIITRKNREEVLYAIAKAFIAQYNVIKGIETAVVTTTIALDDDLRKAFTEVITKVVGKEITLVEKINKDVIGGFVIKVGDKQIDDSLLSKLKSLQLSFTDKAYIKQI